jgi:hypothetical protein
MLSGVMMLGLMLYKLWPAVSKKIKIFKRTGSFIEKPKSLALK